jgi:hypothetical protein
MMESYPKPSKNFIPEWYKGIPRLEKGAKKLSWPFDYEIPNFTVKACIPFLESMSNGYMVYLNNDIFVEQVDGCPVIRWKTDESAIKMHSNEQFPIKNIPFSDIYFEKPFKFMHNWAIKVPKGYSILFSHPQNRIDLPFYSLSGLINCDDYNLAIHFPFLLRKGFEGVIESGTPISQLTIIKNESWKSSVEKYDEKTTVKNYRIFNKTIYGFYKKYIWKKDNSFE